MAMRDLNDEQRFGLVDREERLLEAAMRMRVDDFVRHCRVQVADVVAELARAAAVVRPSISVADVSRAMAARAPMRAMTGQRCPIRRRLLAGRRSVGGGVSASARRVEGAPVA